MESKVAAPCSYHSATQPMDPCNTLPHYDFNI